MVPNGIQKYGTVSEQWQLTVEETLRFVSTEIGYSSIFSVLSQEGSVRQEK